MKPSELVKRGWCRGKLAEDKDGKSVYPESPDAAKWCAIGAIRAAAMSWGRQEESEISRRLSLIVGSIAEWNDRSSQEKVVEMFENLESIIEEEKNETK